NANGSVEFGNQRVIIPPSRYTITSFKYEDINGDGNKDTNEGPVSGWSMTLTGNNTATITQNTGADGRTIFTNLLAGTYTVTEGSREGWRNITPVVRTVTISNANGSVEFGNQRVIIPPSRYTITSFKYEDINGDGNKDTNEGPVSGWSMTLTGNNTATITQNTGADGRTIFTNLLAGTYTVTEGSREGWRNITPVVRTVTISNANDSVEFGNQRVITPTPTPVPTPIPTPQPVDPTTPTTSTYVELIGKGNMPLTGPAEAAAGAAGLTFTGGAAWSWLKSKKALLSALRKIK
ncbi:MAG: SdrD B-like domain-containing protein, partial [bacterium]